MARSSKPTPTDLNRVTSCPSRGGINPLASSNRSAATSSVPHAPSLMGTTQVADPGEGTGSGLHDYQAPKHCRCVQLPAVREVGTDGDDVGARPEQVAVEEGHGAGGAAADEVRPGDLAGTGASGLDPEASS